MHYYYVHNSIAESVGPVHNRADYFDDNLGFRYANKYAYTFLNYILFISRQIGSELQ